jgi:hypothetical protein
MASHWDKELAKIDKQLSSMSDEALLAKSETVPGPAPAAAKAAATLAPAVAGAKGTTTFGVMLRLTLAAALGVGMVFWPYPSRCGPWLFAYLGAAGVLMSAGLWSAVWSWRHRAHKSHILSLLLVLWGGTLAAAEVLPKVGYAIPSEDHPAAWLCG